MTADPHRRAATGLGGFPTLTGRATMRELPPLAQVDLRIQAADAAVRSAVADIAGTDLPVVPNTASGDGHRWALWLGPDEWLILGPSGTESELEARLREAVSPIFGVVVDVSAARAVIELRGPAAREILEAGCAIDLHPRAFGPGSCVQTLLARVNIILWQVTDEPRYRLLVRPSYGSYLVRWLEDAAIGIGGS